MKNIFILIMLALVGCHFVKEDFDTDCVSQCTVIQGFCTTTDNQPIEDLYIEIAFVEKSELHYSERRIENAVTDENGFYKMEFYLLDNELSAYPGYLQLRAFVTDLQEVDTYLASDSFYAGQWKKNLQIDTRDTIIDGSFYLPKMAMLNINLHKYTPVLSGDFFKVKTTFENYIFNREAENITNQIISIPVAVGENNILSVSYKKNGVVTNLDPIPIFIPENENVELDYEY